jgi:hypothetical protein
MLNKLNDTLGKYKHLITILSSFCAVIGFLWVADNNLGAYGKSIEYLTFNQRNVMMKQVRQDSVNGFLLTSMKEITQNIKDFRDSDAAWKTAWQSEHIRLMKMHHLYPDSWNLK